MERRHSDFLAFLLDPSQKHSLDDLFLKRVLQTILGRTGLGPSGLRPVHVELMDLTGTSVQRESHHTDILCINDANRLAVVIENKIDSVDHDDQLKNYYDIVKKNHPDYTRVLIYLTPSGDAPSQGSDEGREYIPVAYSLVCEALEYCVQARQSVIGADVLTTIRHYIEMLRRHIVSDSPIAELAKKIYAKHREALDVIFEHRPDERSEWANHLRELVEASSIFEIGDDGNNTYIPFCPKEWLSIQTLNCGQARKKRLLFFQFQNKPPEFLRLKLLIGPCEQGADEVRKKVFNAALMNPKVFHVAARELTTKWSQIWSHGMLNRADFDSEEPGELFEKVKNRWEQCLTHEMPAIIAAIKQLFQT